jgi:hypothetical protein
MIEVLAEKFDKNQAERLKDKNDYEEAIRLIIQQVGDLNKDINDIIAKIDCIEIGKIRSISSFFCKILRALSVARQ